MGRWTLQSLPAPVEPRSRWTGRAPSHCPSAAPAGRTLRTGELGGNLFRASLLPTPSQPAVNGINGTNGINNSNCINGINVDHVVAHLPLEPTFVTSTATGPARPSTTRQRSARLHGLLTRGTVVSSFPIDSNLRPAIEPRPSPQQSRLNSRLPSVTSQFSPHRVLVSPISTTSTTCQVRFSRLQSLLDSGQSDTIRSLTRNQVRLRLSPPTIPTPTSHSRSL